MIQVSSPRRSRILSSATTKTTQLSDMQNDQEKRQEIAKRCRVIFERLREQLIVDHHNWFIAIDPDREEYLINPDLKGLIQQIRLKYSDNDLKLTIFRLNDAGNCGRLWV
jgi:cytochrome oxidase Cu insertion factor (SCO1/SenC/PrrC family)